MDTTEQTPLGDLPPSAQLARLHAQAKSEEPVVPSRDDPVVVDNAMFAEPLIAGDYPTPIGQPVKKAAPSPTPTVKKDKKLDLSSEAAFPTLSSGTPRPPIVSSGWSSAASRVKVRPTQQQQNQQQKKTNGTSPSTAAAAPSVTDVLELPANQQIANQASKPLGFKGAADVIQQVINKTGTNIIASTNRFGTTTFLIQGAPADVTRAKRDLVTGLVVKRSMEISIPASVRRFIIGAKGKTLQQIEQKSSTRINVPSRKDDDIEEDENVNISIVGDVAGIKLAKAEIEKIVDEKAAKTTLKIEDIDPRYHLFLAGPDNSAVKALEEEYHVTIQMPPLVNLQQLPSGVKGKAVIVAVGDKEKVQQVKQALEAQYADLEKSTRTASIGVPKRQHKYLFGKDGAIAREIFQQSGCTVEVPSVEDASESVIVRGPEQRLINGLTLVMEKSRSVHVNALDIASLHASAADPVRHAHQVITYINHIDAFKKIEQDFNVQVSVVPSPDAASVEFVSKSEEDASNAYRAGYDLCRAFVPERFATLDVEPHLHRHLHVRLGKQLQRIKARHDVAVLFPDAKASPNSPTLLLVRENKKSDVPEDALATAVADINKLVLDLSNIVSSTITVPASYHSAIQGPNGTTLNAILGEDSTVAVQFGTTNPDDIVVRGVGSEVKSAIQEIKKIHVAAKNEDFTNAHTVEFNIPAAYSAHVIGKAGTNINKLKEDLGIKIDIGDNNKNEGGFEAVTSKNKKKDQHVKVVIQGIKPNVEAAKERVQTYVAALADQVTLQLSVPKQFHRFLIGPNGRYVKKLEDKYNVFVKFPKGSVVNGDDSPIPGNNPNTITIRGRKKDATAAKDELNELYEYEKEESEKRKERELKHRQAEEKRKAAAAVKEEEVQATS
ncbi:hypothetical protein DM01DRAFT_1409020 [Hesseltinella vesiculosa]|uniref:K Homology domain-containing protein n=1 Tax=Hesseltinella vesiculosa TaxID=101127 RepID=A0A1X2GCC9_9FUNG|nr:hypothetical protein DM01DRAFT_1409020 [Hesseltinella vesiculosa]